MKLLIIFVLSLNLIYAMSKPLELKVIRFNAGKENKTEISKSDQNKISQILTKLFSNCDEALKLYIDEERIKEIKKTDSGVEILLGKSIVYKTKSLGNYKVKKVLIPFAGDYAADEKSSEVTIFAGEKEYFTPALRNSKGYKDVIELEKIIRKASGQLHK
jgi:hypothetical protein